MFNLVQIKMPFCFYKNTVMHHCLAHRNVIRTLFFAKFSSFSKRIQERRSRGKVRLSYNLGGLKILS